MIVMGLGLVFYGMGLISDAMRPLRFYPPFVEALGRMEKPLYGIIARAVFTLIVNSSASFGDLTRRFYRYSCSGRNCCRA